jgi:hypothetical protein
LAACDRGVKTNPSQKAHIFEIVDDGKTVEITVGKIDNLVIRYTAFQSIPAIWMPFGRECTVLDYFTQPVNVSGTAVNNSKTLHLSLTIGGRNALVWFDDKGHTLGWSILPNVGIDTDIVSRTPEGPDNTVIAPVSIPEDKQIGYSPQFAECAEFLLQGFTQIKLNSSVGIGATSYHTKPQASDFIIEPNVVEIEFPAASLKFWSRLKIHWIIRRNGVVLHEVTTEAKSSGNGVGGFAAPSAVVMVVEENINAFFASIPSGLFTEHNGK